MQCIKDTIKNINIVIGCSYCYARMNNNKNIQLLYLYFL